MRANKNEINNNIKLLFTVAFLIFLPEFGLPCPKFQTILCIGISTPQKHPLTPPPLPPALKSENCPSPLPLSFLNFFKKTLWPLFMDGVQLFQGQSQFEEAVYFLPLSSQEFLLLILSISERRKAESTLEPPSGFQHGTLDWKSSTLTTRSLLHHQAIASSILGNSPYMLVFHEPLYILDYIHFLKLSTTGYFHFA